MIKHLKTTLLALLSLECGLAATHAMGVDVFVGKPPGLVKYVYPEYPRAAANNALSGKGRFLLKINPKTGEVDEVKVLKSTGHVFLNEIGGQSVFSVEIPTGRRHSGRSAR